MKKYTQFEQSFDNFVTFWYIEEIRLSPSK